MYKLNFDTRLWFEKALELLNELGNHEVESEGDGENMFYFNCKINQETKDTLCRLGVKTEKMDFFDEKETNTFNLLGIWSQIQGHYDHYICWTGKKFIVLDREKEVATKAIRHALDFLENEDFLIDGVASDVYEDMLAHLRKADTMLRGKKEEGDTDV